MPLRYNCLLSDCEKMTLTVLLSFFIQFCDIRNTPFVIFEYALCNTCNMPCVTLATRRVLRA